MQRPVFHPHPNPLPSRDPCVIAVPAKSLPRTRYGGDPCKSVIPAKAGIQARLNKGATLQRPVFHPHPNPLPSRDPCVIVVPAKEDPCKSVIPAKAGIQGAVGQLGLRRFDPLCCSAQRVTQRSPKAGTQDYAGQLQLCLSIATTSRYPRSHSKLSSRQRELRKGPPDIRLETRTG